MRRALLRIAGLLAVISGLFFYSCAETEQPPYTQVVVLKGTPYERGFQHGQQLSGRIRSLYTTLLTNSLMPYLNREQTDIASVLARYKNDPEDGSESFFEKWERDCQKTCVENCREKCGFSYLLMLESAVNLKPYIPQYYLDEMQGIADGAQLPFEKILILNTFFDTLLSFRAITYYIREFQAPTIRGVRFLGGVETDGFDNNGDGKTDEEGEGNIQPFEPMPHAAMAEVPTDAQIEFLLHDIKLSIGVDKGDQPGVDPDTVRIRHNQIQYEYPKDKGIIDIFPVEGDPESLRVIFSPPNGFRAAGVEALVVQAGDFNRIVNPPPLHARFMRDERIVFSTKGYGKRPQEIPNVGERDGNTQPPSISFAARRSATADGKPLFAHHYALLDSNTTHKHTVVFIHIPKEGFPHAVLGYSGVIWGFSGMNAQGLTYSFNNSDTLNNQMVGQFIKDTFDAKLMCSGVPIGIIGRDLLLHQRTVQESLDVLKQVRSTFGWNVLLADAESDLAAVELDSNISGKTDGGMTFYRPDPSDKDNLDSEGNLYSSVGMDDIRMGSHYVKNLEEIRTQVLVFDVNPQRYWTSFYYRSLRAYHLLGDQIRSRYKRLDMNQAVDVLRTPDLVDSRDSMMAAIYRPQELVFYYAMGQVPATSGNFEKIDLAAALKEGAGK